MPWISLGTETLRLNEWVFFTPSVNGETFRFTAGNLLDFPTFKTYALVRLSWVDGSTTCYTESKRIYPRPEPLVIDFPIPQDIKEAIGGLVRYVEVKKCIYYRWRGRSQEPAWTLTVEDYV